MRSRAAVLAALRAPAGGAVIALAAVAPPMHAAADASLAAHMVQHLLLILAAAPLLALGHPVRVMLWLLPSAAHRFVACRARLVRISRGQARGLAVGAWVAHVTVLWAWHTPRLYEWAITSPTVHALEHGSLLLTGCAFWSAVLGGRGLGPGAAVVYLFAAAGQGTALGALLALAEAPWYATHAAAGAGMLTPLEDQQVAGLIMWIPGGLAYMTAALAMLARVLRGAPPARGTVKTAGVRSLGLLAVVALAGACGSEPQAPAPIELGSEERGRQAIEKYGCGGCHTIAGVRGARGTVGPALTGLADRPYLAGSLVNEPANLVDWVRAPRRLAPRTFMPDLGVSESDARDIAAFLYRAR